MERLLARTCHLQKPLNTNRRSLLVSLPSIFSISLQLPSFAPIKLNCTPNLMLLVDAIKRLVLRSVLLKLRQLYIADVNKNLQSFFSLSIFNTKSRSLLLLIKIMLKKEFFKLHFKNVFFNYNKLKFK